MLPVAILAGGLGTRVRHLTGDRLPKALLPVAGRPFIDHKLRQLRAGGVTDVWMLVGHGALELRTHVGDGAGFGLRVRYLEDGPDLLGTAGALRRALPLLGPAFFVTYGDTLLDVPIGGLERAFLDGDDLGALTVLENVDRWETSNVDVEGDRVIGYEKPAQAGRHRYLDYGFLAFREPAFAGIPVNLAADLAVVIRALIDAGSLMAFPVHERFHDIGNEEAVLETDAFLSRNMP